ncbi:MAG TPA: response regulator [Phycisphaerales bacterium]|nr:response regulator [Phycisphaerales bacterium]
MANKPLILIVEDEREIANLMRFHVEREGFNALVVHSGRLALDAVNAQVPDLVLLDLMLPDVDGLEVCRRLKWTPATRSVPIIMVTARGEEADIVSGIELGADDYVTKPFSPRVLMARIRRSLRKSDAPDAATTAVRAATSPDSEIGVITLADGAVRIDPQRHIVSVDEKPIDLTVTEFGILQFLAARPGFVRTRDQIISAVHGENTVLSSRTVDVHITALRRKLDPHGELVQTVRGVGYRLAERAMVTEE